MSAEPKTQARPSYFRELDRRLVQSRTAMLVRGALIAALGLLLLVTPRNIIEIVLVVVFVIFVIDGAQRMFAILRGWTLPHLRPMSLMLAVFELGVAALILFRPLGAVRITATLLSLLVIVRGVLIIATMADMRSYRARQRLWMLTSAILSILIGLVMLPRSPDDLQSFANLLGLYVLILGIEQMVRVSMREQAALVAEEALDTIMSREIDRAETFLPGPDPATGAYKMASIENRVTHKPLPPRKTHSASFGEYIDPYQYQRPLIISPHPDDLEGFTGGLVYSLRAPVISVVMSGGDKGRWQDEFVKMSPEQFMEVRLEESADAAQFLGIERILWMGYRDRTVTCNEQSIQRIYNILEYVQPDMVASFEFRKALSYYPHHDHIQTALIVREALRRYAEAGHEVTFYLASTLAPNAFLDVTNIRRIKLEALACHSTQDALNAIIFPFFERLSSAVWGAFNGVQYAEGYRRVDMRDVLRRPPMLPPVVAMSEAKPTS
jgi:LmbE family N-acetylglucosaminyl deacetylase/uncharacterized membrane protein HdeD (DUF308 family)